MIAFPSMLASAAHAAGMAVPDNPDNFLAEDYPHFHVFCGVQLCRPMLSPGEHWENAEIIAAIPKDTLYSMQANDLRKLGVQGI